MEIDKFILNGLANGWTQSDISNGLKNRFIKPNSISFVEKRIRELKSKHEAKTLFHLAIIVQLKKII